MPDLCGRQRIYPGWHSDDRHWLLGELQVRHFHTASHRAPYAVDRILRLRSEESLMQ